MAIINYCFSPYSMIQENIDTLGREIQRISAQLQTYEKIKR